MKKQEVRKELRMNDDGVYVTTELPPKPNLKDASEAIAHLLWTLAHEAGLATKISESTYDSALSEGEIPACEDGGRAPFTLENAALAGELLIQHRIKSDPWLKGPGPYPTHSPVWQGAFLWPTGLAFQPPGNAPRTKLINATGAGRPLLWKTEGPHAHRGWLLPQEVQAWLDENGY